MKKIKIQAPGTVANLVCGFDIMGLALCEPYDEMEFTLLDEPKIILHHTDEYNLPTQPEKNVVGVVLIEMMKKLGGNTGFEVTIQKNIKPGSGLGSSSASAAGAAVGANLLLGEPFTKEELVEFAMFGEQLASGAKHADNITPCIYGGVTLIRSNNPLDIIPLASPELHVAIVHPQIEIKTSDARQILRKSVELKTAIQQWGNIAGLVAGFLKNDNQLIGRSLEDVIVEPTRSILIPGFSQLKKDCIANGALGGGISGSGPSVFMLCETKDTADKVALLMKKTYDDLGIENYTYVSKINPEGVKVVE